MVPRFNRSFCGTIFLFFGGNYMDQKLLDLKTEALSNIEACDNLARINELRVEYLGKKGFLSGLSSNMGKLQPSERAEFGKKINEVKNAITSSLEEKRVKLEEEALNKSGLNVKLFNKWKEKGVCSL